MPRASRSFLAEPQIDLFAGAGGVLKCADNHVDVLRFGFIILIPVVPSLLASLNGFIFCNLLKIQQFFLVR